MSYEINRIYAYKINFNGKPIPESSETQRAFDLCWKDIISDSILVSAEYGTIRLKNAQCEVTITLNWLEGSGEMFLFSYLLKIPSRDLASLLEQCFYSKLGCNFNHMLNAYPSMVAAMLETVNEYMVNFSLSYAMNDYCNNLKTGIRASEIESDPIMFIDHPYRGFREYAKMLI